MRLTRFSRDDPADRRTPLEVFERLYRRRRDPWGYESRREEQDKYQRTLAVLDKPRYSRALEVGCSIGVFTKMLAQRCDHLIALEPSPSALAVARDRLLGSTNVEFVGGAVPEALPGGPFDLVVCSEVLYYLSEGLLVEVVEDLQRRLMPGATLIAVHYTASPATSLLASVSALRRPSPPTPLTGNQVHELLTRHVRLRHTHQERRPTYRLDRFDADR